MPFVKHNDMNIYYREVGAGNPLVCIAGLAAGHDVWNGLLPALAGRFRTVVFDNRGMGRTTAPAAPFDIQRMAEDTCVLMERLKLEKAVIAGHSMGCAIALTLARRRPELVGRMVLFNPFARMNARAEFVFRNNARLWRAGVPTADLFSIIMPWLFSNAFLADDAAVKTLLNAAAGAPETQSVADFERQITAAAEFDSRGWLPEIKIPALLVAGSEDVLTPADGAREMAALMPNARVEVLPAAHLSLAEAPAACADLLQ